MIKVTHLTKRFVQQVAVDDLSFTIEPGEVVGFLGPNGAGKSTTMKMLTGFLPPCEGSVSICGFDIGKQTLQAQRLIGYLPEGAPCYGDMSVADFLNFIGQIRGYRGKELKQRVARAIALVELERVVEQNIDTLSKGFKRRVGLAQAVLHDPKVLILDEPTDGLDPNQKHQVRQLIKSLAVDRIVIISTHILEEVSALCTRAMVISQGRLLIDETPYALQSRSRYHQAVTILAEQSLDRQLLQGLPGVIGLEDNPLDGSITLLAKPGEVIFPAVNQLIHAQGWQVRGLEVERGRLDEVFRSLTRGDAA